MAGAFAPRYSTAGSPAGDATTAAYNDAASISLLGSAVGGAIDNERPVSRLRTSAAVRTTGSSPLSIRTSTPFSSPATSDSADRIIKPRPSRPSAPSTTRTRDVAFPTVMQYLSASTCGSGMLDPLASIAREGGGVK